MAIVSITSISQLNGILSKDKEKLSVKCSLTSDITEMVLIAAGYRLPRYMVRAASSYQVMSLSLIPKI
jgi:hypothetical protein